MAQLPNKKMINRMTFIMICFLLVAFGALIGRMFFLQIIKHDLYEQKAVDQQTRDTIISPKRGTIYDRNLKALAVSASVETVVISPIAVTENKNAELVATGLSEILGIDKDTILEKTKKKNQYETIARKIEKDVADQIREFVKENDISGITLIEDSKRYYPYSTFASHLIGFTGTEEQGLWGAEAYYDTYLKGTAGRIISAKNARGTDMSLAYDEYVDAENGANLVMTIDEVIQHYLEKHLTTAVEENNAIKGGLGIVMDVKTGEILAASVLPDYDLNSPFTIVDETTVEALAALEGDAYKTARSEALQLQWRNRLISDAYEPGSVFKVVTTAIALEENVTSMDDTFTCSGFLKIGGRTINCHKTTGHGHETLVQGIGNSCNPVAMTLAARVGSSTYLKYINAFGLTEKTGVDISGETSGLFHSASVFEGPVELATSSFGQTFTVTPLQMISAIATAVNGGNLMTPRIAKQLIDDKGNVIKTFDTEIRSQVISAETSKQICQIMESVVSTGTGKNAYITGYRVGGKTGTTIKTTEKVEGQPDKKIASFVGVAPMDDPQVAVLILLDEPEVTDRLVGGGAMVAPVVKNILQDILPYLGIAPQYTAEELEKLEVAVINVNGVEVNAAKAALEKLGLNVSISGDGETVLGQLPKAGLSMPQKGTVVLYTQEGYEPLMATVPNVAGMGQEEARAAFLAAGLNMKTSGADAASGAIAVSQSEVANSLVPEGTIVTVEFMHQVSD